MFQPGAAGAADGGEGEAAAGDRQPAEAADCRLAQRGRAAAPTAGPAHRQQLEEHQQLRQLGGGGGEPEDGAEDAWPGSGSAASCQQHPHSGNGEVIKNSKKF